MTGGWDAAPTTQSLTRVLHGVRTLKQGQQKTCAFVSCLQT
jgi:hypothetical protein